jgi:hypothetical protein
MRTRVLHWTRCGTRDRGLAAAAWLACVLAAASVHAQVAEGPAQPAQPAATWDAPAEMIEAALADAGNRSTTARAEIKVASASAVTWPDGSLGCPRAGAMYTQALVPGYKIVLQAGEQTLNYHAGSRGNPVFCPASRAVPPVPGQDPPAL